MEKLASILIAAHFMGAFFVQPLLPKRLTGQRFLVLHAVIPALLAYIGLEIWNCWQAPLIVFLLQNLIERAKQAVNDSAAAFVAGQLVHILSLLGLAWGLGQCGFASGTSAGAYEVFVVFGGFIATVVATGLFVGRVAKRLAEENNLQLNGLGEGGKLIGQLERALIFLLIFTDLTTGIGFLVAAKSILRFEEAKKQQLAEYVLIGTLLSFTLAITLAFATKWASTLPGPSPTTTAFAINVTNNTITIMVTNAATPFNNGTVPETKPGNSTTNLLPVVSTTQQLTKPSIPLNGTNGQISRENRTSLK